MHWPNIVVVLDFFYFLDNDSNYIIYSILIYRQKEPKETYVSRIDRYVNLSRPGCYGYGTTLGYSVLGCMLK